MPRMQRVPWQAVLRREILRQVRGTIRVDAAARRATASAAAGLSGRAGPALRSASFMSVRGCAALRDISTASARRARPAVAHHGVSPSSVCARPPAGRVGQGDPPYCNATS
jgi:hypothetical protein